MSKLKHSISQGKVKQLISHYEKNKKKILKDEFHGKATLPTCETFDRAAFDQLLAQEDCVSIRIYYGMDKESNVKLVAFGVDKNGHDIVSSNSKSKKIKKAEMSGKPVFAFSGTSRCPPDCPPPPPPPPDEL